MGGLFGRALRAGIALAGTAIAAGTIDSAASAQTQFVQRAGAPLSLLSYNVHGLPWPLASDRAAAMTQIVDHLRAMRAEGRQPHVVVLQEAFTDTARQIFRGAGYRYVVEGPSASVRSDVAPSATDRRFASAAQWLKGEAVGRVYGSGLMILSDYPIADVRKTAYPAFACAGYDCLANKGAVMATVQLPNGNAVAVATTHLNSRAASGVGKARSDAAYERQIEILDRFLSKSRDPNLPLVVAGDFNVGKAAVRRDFIGQHAASWSAAGGATPVQDTMHADCALQDATALTTRDLDVVKRRSKDWQFFTAGAALGIKAMALSIPFGRAADGSMLSDHIGYVTHYVLDRPKLALDARTLRGSRLV